MERRWRSEPGNNREGFGTGRRWWLKGLFVMAHTAFHKRDVSVPNVFISSLGSVYECGYCKKQRMKFEQICA